jgi:hypothetical protein
MLVLVVLQMEVPKVEIMEIMAELELAHLDILYVTVAVAVDLDA